MMMTELSECKLSLEKSAVHLWTNCGGMVMTKSTSCEYACFWELHMDNNNGWGKKTRRKETWWHIQQRDFPIMPIDLRCKAPFLQVLSGTRS